MGVLGQVRVDSPVGEMPGECPGAEVPQDEDPKLQQRGCSGSSVSTCENREESVTKVNTGFWRLRKAKGPGKESGMKILTQGL